MSFFKPTPPVPDWSEHDRDQPEWFAPPRNVVGRFADLGALLVRSDDVAVVLDGFVAYPTGVAFRVMVRSRPGRRWDWDWDCFDPFEVPRRHGRDGALMLGAQFADGRACQLGWPWDDGDPEPPALTPSGGGGGGSGEWDQEVWLWPLPPDGPLTFVFRWDSARIQEQAIEVHAGPLHAAANQATLLWPEGR